MQEPKAYKIDFAELHPNKKDFVIEPLFDEFLSKVAVAYPLFEFKATDRCVSQRWKGGESVTYLARVKVFQDGERLGDLWWDMRGHGGNSEPTVGVGSFRIIKHRGHSNATFTKDLKVAMRNVKANLMPRAEDELKHWVKQAVKSKLDDINNSWNQQARWGVDNYAIMLEYINKGYEAHLRGENTVTLPLNVGIKDMENHLKTMVRADEARKLIMMRDNNSGFGVGTQADGTVVLYDYAHDTIKKYRDFDELPKVVADKLSVFKILQDDEFFLAYGARLKNGFYYIVNDEIPSA